MHGGGLWIFGLAQQFVEFMGLTGNFYKICHLTVNIGKSSCARFLNYGPKMRPGNEKKPQIRYIFILFSSYYKNVEQTTTRHN